MSKERQILRFQGYDGSFTIEGSSVIYEIIFQNGNRTSTPPASGGDTLEEAFCSEAPVLHSTGDFFRNISLEMYNKVGSLAKDLSSNLRDFSLEDLKGAELPVTGAQIGSARADLEGVVKMTETATLNIMDLIDAIQEDCQTVQQNVEAIQDLAALKRSPQQTLIERLTSQLGSAAELRGQLIGMLEEKKAAMGKTGQATASQNEPTEAVTSQPTGIFSLDALLQTLYEFCTSEEYKGKIKLMRQKQEELFDEEILQESLRQGAAELDEEDGLYQFAVTYLLKKLEETCANPKVAGFITQFLENADSLFLDSSLPLEMVALENNSSEEPKARDGSLVPPSPTSDLQGDVKRLESMLTKLEQPEALEESISQLKDLSFIRSDDEAMLMEVMERSSRAVAKIGSALTGIVEALSFQDLSGQRILKIVQLLKSVQLQLLSIMVAHDTRVRERTKQPEITDMEEKRLVQSEIDRTMAELTGSEAPEDENGEKLDQDKVNELLESMGF